ncbi:uncharacterized protein LOC121640449 isoform X1 [Melanotaenia boesemani]|uniref:uncharacterized protein LOC121640449 isoform X1 n=1 Tax=Melanotaenia boesemani TaxID=1250792 RepID=UPI001C0499CA|nr:uncharacterized protein LOC121640449 isoform X1 [Melanotaenia boesemani]
MKLAEVFLLCGCLWAVFSGITPQEEDLPLQSDSEPVFAAVHTDAVLPCRSTRPIQLSHVVSLEWLRVDTLFKRTVHVMRDGKELEKEKAMEYRGRTTVMEEGSLKLYNIKPNDTSRFICVLEGSPVETKISLIVVEVFEFNISVYRSSANKLFVMCESSVWNLQPNISLLDADGKVVAVGTERTVGQRNLHLVKVGVKVDAAEGNLKGNGTIICRLEIPKAKLVEEKNICVTDDFIPSEDAGFQCHTLLFVIVALVCIIIVVFVPLWIIEELRFVMADFCIRKIAAWRAGEEGEQLLGDVNFTELGDLNNITTSGASETSAVINNLQQRNGTMVTGVEASNILAEQDLKAMSRYKGIIIQVGKKHHIYPSLIAAIISKQSRAGTILQLNGYGTFDNNCYGLMQINKAFYATSGSPYSLEHIEDGTKHLVHLIKTLKQSEESRNWSPVQHLKGALIAYISGIDKVRAGVATIANVDEALEKLDMETPTDDFANDVFARAKWFANYGY